MESGLYVRIVDYEWQEEEATYQYVVSVQYKQLQWQVKKRYSEFDALQCDLLDSGYFATVPFPSKSVIGRPPDKTFIEKRKDGLDAFLKELVKRPDTRSSMLVLAFLNFLEYTNISIEPAKPSLESTLDGGRMGVTEVVWKPNLLLASLEDPTNFCRLGKVWSLVESEPTGYLTVYAPRQDKSDAGGSSEFIKLHEVPLVHRCRAVAYDETSKRAFVGLDDGYVNIYDIPKYPDEMPTKLDSVQVHSEAVVAFSTCGRRLLSVGYDGSIRTLDLGTGRVISGGRLSRRLGDALITSCALTTQSNLFLAFIGTSDGRLLVYRVDCNPPVHLETTQVDETQPLTSIAVCQRSVLAGHGGTLSCWGFELLKENLKGLKETEKSSSPTSKCIKLTKHAQFSTPRVEGDIVSCSCCHVDTARLFVGYESGGFILWCLTSGRYLVASHLHWQKITQLVILPNDMLVTGSEDGCIKIWALPPADDHRWIEWEEDIPEQRQEEEEDVSTQGNQDRTRKGTEPRRDFDARSTQAGTSSRVTDTKTSSVIGKTEKEESDAAFPVVTAGFSNNSSKQQPANGYVHNEERGGKGSGNGSSRLDESFYDDFADIRIDTDGAEDGDAPELQEYMSGPQHRSGTGCGKDLSNEGTSDNYRTTEAQVDGEQAVSRVTDKFLRPVIGFGAKAEEDEENGEDDLSSVFA